MKAIQTILNRVASWCTELFPHFLMYHLVFPKKLYQLMKLAVTLNKIVWVCWKHLG